MSKDMIKGTTTGVSAKDWEPESNRTGWICPKCGKANAPWKSSCDCTHYVPYVPPYYPVPYWKYEPPYTITCNEITYTS